MALRLRRSAVDAGASSITVAPPMAMACFWLPMKRRWPSESSDGSAAYPYRWKVRRCTSNKCSSIASSSTCPVHADGAEATKRAAA